MDKYKHIIDNFMPGIDVWDDKYDYVMHDDHWLSLKWSPDCQKCQAEGKKPLPPPPPSNNTTTSSPVRNSSSMNSTNDPTLKNNHMDISPEQVLPPPVTIAMTPIAPPHMSNRAFVTPYTGSKYGHETFNRSTRQSAKKLLSQTQDLIDLNETFDLYRSALADTPQIEHPQQPQHQQQPLQQQQPTSRIPKIPVRLSRP